MRNENRPLFYLVQLKPYAIFIYVDKIAFYQIVLATKTVRYIDPK